MRRWRAPVLKFMNLAATFITRWTRRILAALLSFVLLYHLWLIGWVLWWSHFDPGMTRFMEIRLAELQAANPAARLKKHWVDYESISPQLKRALIAAEDALFLQHDGFDWNGIQRALQKNKRSGKIVAGGSTITQQLAKNLFLSPKKTPWRKAEEALVTLMIENIWSKRRIFEVYLNVIEWGNGVFGAEAAAQYYFGVNAAKIDAEQAAHLAAIVPNPRFYDRYRNTPKLAAKAAIILSQMPTAKVP